MSEVKGVLLTIVLTLTVFSIIFLAVTVAMQDEIVPEVTEKMVSGVTQEPPKPKGSTVILGYKL